MKIKAQQVRLFPSAHITSDREAELRATSALLSMLCAVNEFGREVLKDCGAPAGNIVCYSEANYSLEQANGQPPLEMRPDGAIHVTRGKTSWCAFVEVKVGGASLEKEQVDNYHRLAKQEGFNAVITISNQAASSDGTPPVALDGRRLRSVSARHFSWERLLSEAQILGRKKAVSDPDQEWMLSEWIRYIDDPKSRIVVAPDLGDDWGVVVKAARTGQLSAKAPEVISVAEKWRAYLTMVALRLRAKLGAEVSVRIARNEKNNDSRQIARIAGEVEKLSAYVGALKVKGAAGDLEFSIFPGSKSAKFSVEFSAPNEGRQTTRLNWLARQMKRIEIPAGTILQVAWSVRGLVTEAKATAFTDALDLVLRTSDGALIQKDVLPKRFTLYRTVNLRTGKGKSSAPVLEGLTQELERFYSGLVEHITPYSPSVPKLKSPVDLEEVRPTKSKGVNAANSTSAKTPAEKSNEDLVLPD